MDIKITLCAMVEISPFGLIKVKKTLLRNKKTKKTPIQGDENRGKRLIV